MSRLNGIGPDEEGSMTGRGMGNCSPDNKGKINDEILGICTGLAVALIIGVTKIVAIWMKEKRLKSTIK